MTSPPSPLSATEIYNAATGGYFEPDNPATTLEILNAGLDRAGNYGGGVGSLKAYMAQIGAFVCGSYQGFDEWTFIYAAQLGDDTAGATPGQGDAFRCVHSHLATNAFLPWTATKLFYWIHMFARQDATYWDADGGLSTIERWDYRFLVDGTEQAATHGRLPYSRTTDDIASLVPLVNSADSSENRWRFHTRIGMITTGTPLDAGLHELKMSFWAKIGNFFKKGKQ